MIDDGWLLAQKAQLLSLEIEMNGMIALNQYRLSRDETIAYDDEAFQEKADACQGIFTEIMEYR